MLVRRNLKQRNRFYLTLMSFPVVSSCLTHTLINKNLLSCHFRSFPIVYHVVSGRFLSFPVVSGITLHPIRVKMLIHFFDYLIHDARLSVLIPIETIQTHNDKFTHIPWIAGTVPPTDDSETKGQKVAPSTFYNTCLKGFQPSLSSICPYRMTHAQMTL